MVKPTILLTWCPWFELRPKHLFKFLFYFNVLIFAIIIIIIIAIILGFSSLFFSFFIFISFIFKQLTISNNKIDSMKCFRFTLWLMLLPFSPISVPLSCNVDHKMFTLLPSIKTCGVHLIYHRKSIIQVGV